MSSSGNIIGWQWSELNLINYWLMSSRDFLTAVAVAMGKQPAEFNKFVEVLEENFLDTVESLREVSDE